jgi:hypothetical protein
MVLKSSGIGGKFIYFIPLHSKRKLKSDFLIMLTLVVCNDSTLFVERDAWELHMSNTIR